MISILYAEVYHDVPLKTFCLTVPKNFVGETFSVSEKFRYRKFLWVGRGGREYHDFPSKKSFCRPKNVSEQSKMLNTVCTADISRHISSLQEICSIAFDIKNQPRNTENRKLFAKKLLCKSWFRQS